MGSNLIKSLSERKNIEYMIKNEEIIPIDFAILEPLKKIKN